MIVGPRLTSWLFCACIVMALPVVGSTNVAAASGASTSHTAAPSSHGAALHAAPILPLTAKERAAARSRTMHRGGTRSATSLALGSAARGDETPSTTSGATTSAAPLTASTPPDDLADFAGTAQATAIHDFGSDQEITPPNEDVAAGPADIVEVVNSTIFIFSRTGAILGSADLNTFMDVADGYYSSDPRVIYDASGGRFWVTITEVPDEYQSPSDCPESAPVLIAVSGSSNPLPFSGWTVYGLPMETFGGSTGQPLTEFGDQPGLGISSNTVTVTFDDYTCDRRVQRQRN